MNNEDNNRTTLPVTNLEQNSSHESVGTEEITGFASPVIITVTSYRKRNHDTDGISVKAVLDGIVRAGILADDSAKEIKEIRFKSIKSSEEKTIIEITDDL